MDEGLSLVQRGVSAPPFLLGPSSLPASFGSRLWSLPFPRAAGKVLLTMDLFHCLHSLMAPPGLPAPRRDGFLQEGSRPRPKEEPPAATQTGTDGAWQMPGR